MKRQPSPPLLSPQPTEAGKGTFLKPLLDADKIWISGRHPEDSAKNIANYELYKKFDTLKQDFNGPKPKEGIKRLQLANFIVNALSKQGAHGTLDSLNLLKTPKKDPVTGANMDLYNPSYGKAKQQIISLSPNNKERNPITTLMHEGVHALDDAQMRTYQNEAIDYLADQEKQGNLNDTQLKSLIEGAQGIFNNRSSRAPTTFQDEYKYEDFFKPNIDKSFAALQEKNSPAITNFQGAQAELNKIRQTGEDPGDSFLVPFSEFPAFAMEKLFYPWNIDQNTNPQSKEFLGKIMNKVRGDFKNYFGLQNPTYRDFKYASPYNSMRGLNQLKESNPTGYKTTPDLYTPEYSALKANNPGELATKRSSYPDVYQAFKDRKSQFKNPIINTVTGTPPTSPLTPSAQYPSMTTASNTSTPSGAPGSLYPSSQMLPTTNPFSPANIPGNPYGFSK